MHGQSGHVPLRHIFLIARSTRSGVKGQSLTQAPTASWIAIAIAGAAPLSDISETLLPPKGPTSSAPA